MRKNNDNSSQIYLLSLDTFMIMTVMGITLGIIFFILNPTLNSGISLNTSKTEIYLNENMWYPNGFTVNVSKPLVWDKIKKNYIKVEHPCGDWSGEYNVFIRIFAL